MVQSAESLQTGSIPQQFRALDGILAANRHWWQFQPFHHRQLCWRLSHPELCAALEALSDDEIELLERDSVAAVEWLLPWIADGRRLQELVRLPRFAPREFAFDSRFNYGIPGRKWQQILAFAGCLPRSGEPLLEWCAGKGHLGRLLSTCDQRAVTSLEWQQGLCREGERLAGRGGAEMRFVCCDAFAAEAGDWVGPGAHAVALHACGDLHTTLMRCWVRQRGGSLSLSPCCYHLVRGEAFEPLSDTAARAHVRLSRADLRLPLQETVTAGAGVRRLRRTELHWRLAFDELQRELRDEDSYLPLPNVKKSLLSGSFGEFARWAAGCKGLALPAVLNEEEWLVRGLRRLRNVRRMELVAHLFRRPLELWLVLDRALFLLEQGAEVHIGEFCPRELTPRNILLQAHW